MIQTNALYYQVFTLVSPDSSASQLHRGRQVHRICQVHWTGVSIGIIFGFKLGVIFYNSLIVSFGYLCAAVGLVLVGRKRRIWY